MPGCESKLDQEDFKRKEKEEFRDREDGDIEDDFDDDLDEFCNCPDCWLSRRWERKGR